MTGSIGTPKSGWQRVQEALDYGGLLYDSDADFDAACDHVARLLADGAQAYTSSSYGTAAFLAITGLEEIAKAHVGIFRPANPTTPKGRDPATGTGRPQHARAHG